MAGSAAEAIEEPLASEEEEQVSEGEQEVTEPAQAAASAAEADAAATPHGTAASDEQPGSRPASRGTEASDETGSETDFTALHHEAAAARAAKPARERAAPPPALTEAALASSPWVDLEHPVTLYEGVKLVLMAPVVLLKVGACAAAVGKSPCAVRGLLQSFAAPPLVCLPQPHLARRCWCWRWRCPTPGRCWRSYCWATSRRQQ